MDSQYTNNHSKTDSLGTYMQVAYNSLQIDLNSMFSFLTHSKKEGIKQIFILLLVLLQPATGAEEATFSQPITTKEPCLLVQTQGPLSTLPLSLLFFLIVNSRITQNELHVIFLGFLLHFISWVWGFFGSFGVLFMRENMKMCGQGVGKNLGKIRRGEKHDKNIMHEKYFKEKKKLKCFLNFQNLKLI